MKNNKTAKLILLFTTIIFSINLTINSMILLITSLKNKKNVFKKVRYIKEYEMLVPKNMSKKEIQSEIKEMIEDENKKANPKVKAYAFKIEGRNKVYNLKKTNINN